MDSRAATTLRYLSILKRLFRRSLDFLVRDATRHLCLCVDDVLLDSYVCVCACTYDRVRVCVCVCGCTDAWKALQCQAQPFQGTIAESPKTRRQTLCVWHVNEKFRELKAGLAGRPVRKTDDSVLAIIVCCAIRGSNGAAWLRGMDDRVDALGKLGLIVRWRGWIFC